MNKDILNKFIKSKYWNQKRTYSSAEALLHVLISHGKEHPIRDYAERWNWSKSTVCRFLLEIEKQFAICKKPIVENDKITGTTNGTGNGTGISSINEACNELDGTTFGTENGTTKGVINDITVLMQNTLEIRRNDFMLQCRLFADQYPLDMLTQFYDYWTEQNKNLKMRFELQPTWDLSKRLKRWSLNSYGNIDSKQKKYDDTRRLLAENIFNARTGNV